MNTLLFLVLGILLSDVFCHFLKAFLHGTASRHESSGFPCPALFPILLMMEVVRAMGLGASLGQKSLILCDFASLTPCLDLTL